MIKRYRIVLLAVVLILLSAVIALSVVSNGGIAARAETTVGAEIIKAEALFNSYTYYKEDAKGADGKPVGGQIRVSCTKQATSLSYDMIDYANGGVTTTVNIDLGGEGVTLANDMYTTIVTVTRYSDITFKVKYTADGEEVEETAEVVVNCIDNAAPWRDATMYSTPTKEGSAYKWTVYLSDDGKTLSAMSGIKRVMAFVYNGGASLPTPTRGEITQEDYNEYIERTYTVLGEPWENTGTDKVTSKLIDFTMDVNGEYYVYAEDVVGNKNVIYIGTYNGHPQYSLDMTVNGVKITLDTELTTLMSDAEDMLKTENASKINKALISDLTNAYENFLKAFKLPNEDETKRNEEQVSAYNLLSAAKKAVFDAETTYTVDIVNGDLFDKGKNSFSVINLEEAVTTLEGDKIVLSYLVSSYEGGALSRFQYGTEINTLSAANGISAADKVIHLSYRLVQNELYATLTKPLVVQLEIMDDAEFLIVKSADNKTFTLNEYVRDGHTVQFSTTSYSENFYLVFKYHDVAEETNVTLIIGCTLGGVAFVLIVVVVLYNMGVLSRKKKKPIKKDIFSDMDEILYAGEDDSEKPAEDETEAEPPIEPPKKPKKPKRHGKKAQNIVAEPTTEETAEDSSGTDGANADSAENADKAENGASDTEASNHNDTTNAEECEIKDMLIDKEVESEGDMSEDGKTK